MLMISHRGDPEVNNLIVHFSVVLSRIVHAEYMAAAFRIR